MKQWHDTHAPVGLVVEAALFVAVFALVAVLVAGCADPLALELDGHRLSVSRSTSPTPPAPAPLSPSSLPPGPSLGSVSQTLQPGTGKAAASDANGNPVSVPGS